MASRKPIPKSVRFEVFKRDSFKCQYCGESAPSVALVVDHVVPVASGGGNEITNLITSCFDCNAGKGARKLSDDTALIRQKKQLDDLQARREQIEMMADWHRSLLGLEDEQLNVFLGAIQDRLKCGLSDMGISEARKGIKRFGLQESLASLAISAGQYLEMKEGKPTEDSIEKVIVFTWKIAAVRKADADKPYLTRLRYVRGILNKRVNLTPWGFRESLDLLEQAFLAGASEEELTRLAKRAYTYTRFKDDLDDLVAMYGAIGDEP